MKRGIAVVVVMLAASACGIVATDGQVESVGHPVPDESSAIAAAQKLTHLGPPVVLVRVEQGRAGELYSGPSGLFPNQEEADKARAKRDRQAWLVVVTGQRVADCTEADCSPDLWREDLVIDRETGELLFLVLQGAIDNPGRDVPCNPVICPGQTIDP